MVRHRNRVAQRTDPGSGRQSSTPRSLTSPLALPLHGNTYTQASCPDALLIQSHTNAALVELHDGSTTSAAIPTELTRGGPSGVRGGARQQNKTPTDFKQRNASCGLGTSSQSTLNMKQRGPDKQMLESSHSQRQQRQQQQQRIDGAPLEDTRLGLTTPHFGAHKSEVRLSNGSCAVTWPESNTSGPRGKTKPEVELNRPRMNSNQHVDRQLFDEDNNNLLADKASSLVLVSKSTLSNLTEQMAFSMSKMRDLEEKVQAIPELQRRLHSVISDKNAVARSEPQCSECRANNDDLDHQRVHGMSGNPSRRCSLDDSNDSACKTMFLASLRQPYGGSMRCTPGYQASNMARAQQRNPTSTSSFSLSSPRTPSQRYFDKLVRNEISSNHGNSRQSLDLSCAPRSTRDSLNCAGNPDPSSKVEYEDLINDLISLSYSVTLPSSENNSTHSRSSYGNHSRFNETHGNILEPHDTASGVERDICNSKINRSKQIVSTQPLLSKSNGTYQLNNNNDLSQSYSTMNHLPHSAKNSNNSNQNIPYLACDHNGSGSLSIQAMPVGIHPSSGFERSSKEQRASISRELRLSGVDSQQIVTGFQRSNTNSSSQTLAGQKIDASTNTDLSMNDVVTKSELEKLVSDIRRSRSSMSPKSSGRFTYKELDCSLMRNIASSPMSDSSSGSATGPNSLSHSVSRSSSKSDGRLDESEENASEESVGMKTNSAASAKDLSEDHNLIGDSGIAYQDERNANNNGTDDDDDEDIEVNVNSIDGAEEAYSLGSSYQDPSDFEEYCAYGQSLDRRTKDFLSQTTRIPNDLRFALIRLNDCIKKRQTLNQIESSSNCIDVIKKEWFMISASKDSKASETKLYVDYFESFTKQLLNMVINLTDTAGNTAMHYAASNVKLDILEILLDTKVCDVNCRNKAGYTPIMLLALAKLERPYEQEIARHLFTIGDVDIRARPSGQTALMLAASHGRAETCRLLLECGADPALQDYDGSTALICGSELGSESVVRCLLAHKSTDPNVIDNDGLDALTIAMNNGHKNIGLILYAAQNVPTRSAIHSGNPKVSSDSSYLGASLRRSRGKSVIDHVKRAESLLGHGHARLVS